MTVSKDKVVMIHYSLKDDSGKLIDSSEGNDPLAYIHGNGSIIKGLETALDGKTSGDKVDATIPAVEAYGERNEALIQKVELSKFDDPSQVQPGVQFRMEGPDGAAIAEVILVEGDTVTLDANHPLAGKTLHFSVEIISTREATEEELEHGHVHGPGGHQH